MENLQREIGKKIKIYRKKKLLTVAELSEAICKSKATVSKYENGQISMDILTLYDIARVLGVHVEQLLHPVEDKTLNLTETRLPAFFRNTKQLYLYYYDGRCNEISIGIMDILSKTGPNTYKIMLYFNINAYDIYQDCENTYWGILTHYDALSTLTLMNQNTPTEQLIITILSPFLDVPHKWGLLSGISTRPLMPVATKVFISKTKHADTEEFRKDLKISKEDIRLMKLYNMLSIT